MTVGRVFGRAKLLLSRLRRNRMPTDHPSDTDKLRAECDRLGKALALAERDRQLLGYEIHDDVVQDLTAAIMLLESAGRHAQFSPADSSENYARGLRLLHETISSARRLISGAVLPSRPGLILRVALEQLCDKFREEGLLPVTLHYQVPDVKLSDSIQHLLLRIVQESLRNVWKHAQATHVEVQLAKNDDQLELSIADNGRGFDLAQIPPDRFGLEGIRARAQVLGASVLFDTAPNHGTRIIVRFEEPTAA